jgi:hypothetical protein
MKITLLGVLAVIGVAGLLIYVGSELRRKRQEEKEHVQPPQAPTPSPMNPNFPIEL